MGEPKEGVRLYVLETTVYEIRHPELAMVGQSTVTIHVPSTNLLLPVGLQEVIIALLHITRLEPLPPTASASGNGG
jgi:hypothetical protein